MYSSSASSRKGSRLAVRVSVAASKVGWPWSIQTTEHRTGKARLHDRGVLPKPIRVNVVERSLEFVRLRMRANAEHGVRAVASEETDDQDPRSRAADRGPVGIDVPQERHRRCGRYPNARRAPRIRTCARSRCRPPRRRHRSGLRGGGQRYASRVRRLLALSRSAGPFLAPLRG